MGKEIFHKYNMKDYPYEKILLFQEIHYKKQAAIFVLTDLRMFYAMKNSSVNYKKVMLYKVKEIVYY